VTRREALALVLVALLIVAGRGVRSHLLVNPDGAWRDPQWLADRLPDLPPPPEAPRKAEPVLSGPVDPNTCPRDSLLALPGIGPALADRILDARARGVQFATVDDLRVVKGIGPKLSARLAPWLRFDPARPSGGAAAAGAGTPAPEAP
jgi:competence protein ComEA